MSLTIDDIVQFEIDEPDRSNVGQPGELWMEWIYGPLNNQGPKLSVRWYTGVGIAGDMKVAIVRSPGSKHEAGLCYWFPRGDDWEEGVRAAIDEAKGVIEENKACPLCGARMIAKDTWFWFCTRKDCQGRRKRDAKVCQST